MDERVPSTDQGLDRRPAPDGRVPDAVAAPPRYRHLAEIASAAMRRDPDAACIVFRDKTWSNGAIDRWSRAIAVAIRARSRDGAGNGRVGLLAGRGPGFVAGFLGILRADRAAIPCDPAQAPDRTRAILADAAPDLVLAEDPALADRLGIPADRVVAIGPLEAASVPELSDIAWGDGTQPAYLLYTSGSTGRPKGVVCHHLGICNLVEHPPWEEAPAGPLLLTSPVTFDPVVHDIALALRHGLTLVIADDETAASGPDLTALMRREAVAIADMPPSLLAAIPAGLFPDLKIVLAGGEICSQRIIDEWAPRVALYNCYGPTETAVEVTRWRWSAGEPGNRIGRPLGQVVLRVVDAAGRDANEGELLIGGPMVALGYLGLPEATAAAFFLCRETGLRFYRTGDRVRRQASGVYDFLGRLDDQIKLSGVRIEPGEVRSAIEAVAGVASAAIVVQSVEGHASLVGFYGGSGAPEPAAIIEELSQRLLPAMIPARLIKLGSIPTLASGKTDLDALRRLISVPSGGAVAADDAEASLPLSETGRALVALWCKLLNRGSVRLTDNFFALGGDSLRLTQAIFAVNQAYRVRLTPSVFRGLADLQALIAFVEQAAARSVSSAPPQRRDQPQVVAGE